jgi:hypothetical protein
VVACRSGHPLNVELVRELVVRLRRAEQRKLPDLAAIQAA